MTDTPNTNSIFILWSSQDREVAENMVFMYAHNGLKKLWWDRVRIIIWGPSAKLTASDAGIRDRLREMMADGVEVWICRACADNYGITAQLEKAGFDVFHVGESTTNMLKSGWKTLTL